MSDSSDKEDKYAYLDRDLLAVYRKEEQEKFDRAVDIKVLHMLENKLYVCNLRESVNAARKCRKLNVLFTDYYQWYRKKWGFMN